MFEVCLGLKRLLLICFFTYFYFVDHLTGDGVTLEERDGRPPSMLEIISALEANNYLDANNVWYLQYLLKQLDREDLYQKVWFYANERFKKHKTLYLHRSPNKGKYFMIIVLN